MLNVAAALAVWLESVPQEKGGSKKQIVTVNKTKFVTAAGGLDPGVEDEESAERISSMKKC